MLKPLWLDYSWTLCMTLLLCWTNELKVFLRCFIWFYFLGLFVVFLHVSIYHLEYEFKLKFLLYSKMNVMNWNKCFVLVPLIYTKVQNLSWHLWSIPSHETEYITNLPIKRKLVAGVKFSQGESDKGTEVLLSLAALYNALLLWPLNSQQAFGQVVNFNIQSFIFKGDVE